MALAVLGGFTLLVLGAVFLLGGGATSIAKRAVLENQAESYFKRNSAAILTCFHPTGSYERSGEISVESSNTIVGTIFWKGGFVGLQYVSTVRVHVPEASGDPVVAQLVTDSATIPAIQRSCSWGGR